MRKNLIPAICALVTLFAGSALTAETSPAAAEVAPPDSTSSAHEQVALPDQIAGQLTPEPLDRIGVKNGPCTVLVQCPGFTISCSGNNICYWKVHTSWASPGFVECDGRRTTCQISPE